MQYSGGCHCGLVRFVVEAPEAVRLTECNCSICSKSGFLHLIVMRVNFSILSGEEQLRSYTFGTHTAIHRFCEVCGIKSFYYPRSHPDGVSINARCLDEPGPQILEIRKFDGLHWEQGIEQFRKQD